MRSVCAQHPSLSLKNRSPGGIKSAPRLLGPTNTEAEFVWGEPSATDPTGQTVPRGPARGSQGISEGAADAVGIGLADQFSIGAFPNPMAPANQPHGQDRPVAKLLPVWGHSENVD